MIPLSKGAKKIAKELGISVEFGPRTNLLYGYVGERLVLFTSSSEKFTEHLLAISDYMEAMADHD